MTTARENTPITVRQEVTLDLDLIPGDKLVRTIDGLRLGPVMGFRVLRNPQSGKERLAIAGNSDQIALLNDTVAVFGEFLRGAETAGVSEERRAIIAPDALETMARAQHDIAKQGLTGLAREAATRNALDQLAIRFSF